MSGSYDRRPPGGPYPNQGGGPPLPGFGAAAPAPAGSVDRYAPSPTGPTQAPTGYPGPDLAGQGYASQDYAAPSHAAPGHGAQGQGAQPDDDWRPPAPPRYDDLYAPTPTDTKDRPPSTGPIVPAGTVTGSSLTLVVAIMTFLACLTVGAVWLINQSATAWLRDIASEITVQIEPKDRVDSDKQVAEVERFLGAEPGIFDARALSKEQSQRLLEPWIGKTEGIEALPIPRLIALRIDRNRPPDLADLRARLTQRFPTASLDDHRQWQRQIRTVTRSFALGGIAILLLVCAATAAIIISATRSAMMSNREIVEVLHLVGATDRFIAREFERQFMLLGVRAGLVGALAAMAVFFLMPWIMQVLGGGSVALSELQRLIGAGVLDTLGYGVLSSVVLVIAGICMVTCRLGVYRILRTQA